MPVGRDAAQVEFDTLGETGGAKTHALTGTELPAHAHAITHGISPGSGSSNRLSRAATLSGLTADGAYSANFGGGVAHNNFQPFQVVNWMVKT